MKKILIIFLLFIKINIFAETIKPYNIKNNGTITASGEKYNRDTITAAHKTLPFGTQVKITNLINKKSVTVRINDRTNEDNTFILSDGAFKIISNTKGVINSKNVKVSIVKNNNKNMKSFEKSIVNSKNSYKVINVRTGRVTVTDIKNKATTTKKQPAKKSNTRKTINTRTGKVIETKKK